VKVLKMQTRRTVLLQILLGACVSITAPLLHSAEDLLARGNSAYHEGEFAEAIHFYESTDSRQDYLSRKFNAGVSFLREGKLDEALTRFEDVSARGDGELARQAFYNLGYCHFQAGTGMTAATPEPDPSQPASPTEAIDRRIEQLTQAATSYRSAAGFYRKVKPADDDVDHNIAVTKTALIAVVDELTRLQEEKKRLEEEEALKDPAELLRSLIEKEKLHRSLGRALAREKGSRVRVASRRLSKAEAETRVLTEKLHHYLEKALEEEPPQGEPPPSDEEKARTKQASEAVDRAISAQKEAEVAYSQRIPAEATGHHSTAIAELRSARTAFPIDLGELVQEGLKTQTEVLEVSRSIEHEQTGGLGSETKGSGFGKMLVDALKDNVLKPLAKKLTPSRDDELDQLADQEGDVVWVAGILKQAEIPASPPEAAPGQPSPHAPEGPQLTEDEAKALSELIRGEAAVVEEYAIAAVEELTAHEIEPAVPPQEEALAALERIVDLLPKPPESPEEKLRRLIEQQTDAQGAAEGIEDLEAEALSQAAARLSETQREDGRLAGEVATELEARQDEKAQGAAPKVREGEEHIFSSAEALTREQPREGKESIDKAIEALKEALAILSGQQDQQKKDQQKNDQNQDQQKKEQQKKEQKNQEKYALTPRQARMLREEMDRKRREEEEKLFSSSPSVTVDRDW